MLLATQWSLVGAKGSQKLFIYLCDNFFLKNPLFKVVNVHATIRKIRKMLIATRWSLVGAKGSQNLFIYTYATQFFSKKPFSKLLMFM